MVVASLVATSSDAAEPIQIKLALKASKLGLAKAAVYTGEQRKAGDKVSQNVALRQFLTAGLSTVFTRESRRISIKKNSIFSVLGLHRSYVAVALRGPLKKAK